MAGMRRGKKQKMQKKKKLKKYHCLCSSTCSQYHPTFSRFVFILFHFSLLSKLSMLVWLDQESFQNQKLLLETCSKLNQLKTDGKFSSTDFGWVLIQCVAKVKLRKCKDWPRASQDQVCVFLTTWLCFTSLHLAPVHITVTSRCLKVLYLVKWTTILEEKPQQ